MHDLISIGHITIDLYYKGQSLTLEDNRYQLALGGKYHADYFYESVGGGGANVAVGAAKNGLKSAILAKIGNNPFKHFILKKLDENDVSDEFIKFKDDYISISSILLNDNGEKTAISYSPTQGHLIDTKKILHDMINSRSIYLSSLQDVSLDERIAIVEWADNNNILTFVNLGADDCRRNFNELTDLLQKTKILILNAHEFSDLIKKDYEAIDFRVNILKINPQLQNKVLIITDGKNGSYGYDKDSVHYQTAIEPHKIVDTTGAGDGYTASFIAEYLRTSDLAKAMESGSRYASSILEKIGAN